MLMAICWHAEVDGHILIHSSECLMTSSRLIYVYNIEFCRYIFINFSWCYILFHLKQSNIMLKILQRYNLTFLLLSLTKQSPKPIEPNLISLGTVFLFCLCFVISSSYKNMSQNFLYQRQSFFGAIYSGLTKGEVCIHLQDSEMLPQANPILVRCFFSPKPHLNMDISVSSFLISCLWLGGRDVIFWITLNPEC